MIERRSAPQTVAWFLDFHHAKQLDLDPAYQRKSVWNLDYKQYFIDTVLRNYPSPAIFLDVEITATRSIYHVVDGKQRLTAIIEFVLDKFQTSEGYSGPEIGRKYYSELPEEFQTKFRRYVISVEFLDNAQSEELEQAFDRLNRNVSKLNSQELRNARYSGAFIRLMETLADDPFWVDVGIASKARIRRMLDIEFVSEIFVLTMRGISDKDTLDEIYSEFDVEIPDVEANRRKFEACKSAISALWPHLTNRRFGNLADFYSLWAAIQEIQDEKKKIDYEKTGERLSGFADTVREGTKDATANEYLVAATQGSNKAANRALRAKILRKYFVVAK